MKKLEITAFVLVLLAFTIPITSQAEILAMANYESKPEDSLKELKMPFGNKARKEGIAIFDIDPESKNFGNILMDIPLPADLVSHHIFWNRDHSKIYLTALGKPELRVINMTQMPYRIKLIEVPECLVGEDVVFSEDNTKWYLTCMGSSKIMVGDAVNDTLTNSVDSPVKYPHGITINEEINRMLVTSTVRATDLGDPGNRIGILELSSMKNLGSISVTDQPSPNDIAPVEVVFVPKSNPPVAWVTNMNDASLWTLTWNPKSNSFDSAAGFDFLSENAAVPLEIYFDDEGKEMHVTSSLPGKLHFFKLNKSKNEATIEKTISTAGGAHHVAYTKDGKYAFVQNSFINLPKMNDGSITVVDLATRQVVKQWNTLKDSGFNPNCIVLLGQWNDPRGH